MKKVSSVLLSEKGISLIEILTSIVILSIIIFSLLSIFVQSSRTNSYSKKIDSATFVAESNMEEVYQAVVDSRNLSDTVTSIPKKGYTFLNNTATNAYFEKNVENHYIRIELAVDPAPNNTMVKTQVKVYKDKESWRANEQALAQMELVLPWKK